jgi:hypothetical protein
MRTQVKPTVINILMLGQGVSPANIGKPEGLPYITFITVGIEHLEYTKKGLACQRVLITDCLVQGSVIG